MENKEICWIGNDEDENEFDRISDKEKNNVYKIFFN